jgi:hypothetical protein
LDIAAVVAIAAFIIWFIRNSSKKRIRNNVHIAKAPNDKKSNDENME